MNKNDVAKTPPMGWNSYDYYDTTVNEQQIRDNAVYMAEKLKGFGWEYMVVDIQWYAYDTGSMRGNHQYIPFWKVEMDEYSRLHPCPDRFPSSIGGQGFKPLADYVHSLGLKFGIHIMRGIPRIAAQRHSAILGSSRTANEIAAPNSICFWNPDMYGLIPDAEGAQDYYNSLFNLYAEWGVDFIKCDDICRMDAESAKQEIVMMHNAIMQCGRPMVFSLSPGPAKIEEAWHYSKYANMWRITDDFWDNWPLLLNMFERAELWQNHVAEGCYPDCDMLPVGMIGKGFDNEHDSYFSKNEQITMMTLWCIFRSPLMIGAELTRLDDWTLKLLTNGKALGLLKNSSGARQCLRNKELAVWISFDNTGNSENIAMFNLNDEEQEIRVSAEDCGLEQFSAEVYADAWTEQKIKAESNTLFSAIPAHGALLLKAVP